MQHWRPWQSPVLRLLLAQLSGFVWIAAGAVLLACLLLVCNVPAWLLVWLSDAIWCASGFRAGRCAGFHARHSGIRHGMLCGVGMGAVLMLACLVLKGTLSRRVMVRCMLLLAAAVCGGVCGVNTRLRRPPY